MFSAFRHFLPTPQPNSQLPQKFLPPVFSIPFPLTLIVLDARAFPLSPFIGQKEPLGLRPTKAVEDKVCSLA